MRLFKYLEKPYFGPLAAPMLAEDFPRRPMRSLVTIKRDGARQPALDLERPPEKSSAAAISRLAQSRKSTVFPFSDFSGLRINHGERLLSCNRQIGVLAGRPAEPWF